MCKFTYIILYLKKYVFDIEINRLGYIYIYIYMYIYMYIYVYIYIYIYIYIVKMDFQPNFNYVIILFINNIT